MVAYNVNQRAVIAHRGTTKGGAAEVQRVKQLFPAAFFFFFF